MDTPIEALGHAEYRCPDLESSVDHFTDLVGLIPAGRDGNSVYLRGWGEWERYSLVLTESADPGLGHASFRVTNDEELAALEGRIEASGYETRWIEAGTEPGQGRALRCAYPGSHAEHEHELEFYCEMARADVPEAERSRLLNQPQKIPSRGVAPRKIDHVNVMVPNVTECREWVQDVLGFRLSELVRLDGADNGAFLSPNAEVQAIVFVENERAQLNHVAYYCKNHADLFRAADLVKDDGASELFAGPGHHGAGGSHFLYTVEPSGNLLEWYNGGYLIHEEDWDPIVWEDEAVLEDGIVWWGDDYVARGDWPQSSEKR